MNTLIENGAAEVAAQKGEHSQELPGGNFDALDLSKFRVPQEDFADARGPTIITALRVGKPAKASFFRTHPSPDYRMPAGLIIADMGEAYLVVGALRDSLLDEPTFSLQLLVTCVTRGGTPFIWPIKLNSDNRWIVSAHRAATLATNQWIRLKSNGEGGAYDAVPALNQSAVPKWPELSLPELMTLGFAGRIIDSADHPLLRQLRGE